MICGTETSVICSTVHCRYRFSKILGVCTPHDCEPLLHSSNSPARRSPPNLKHRPPGTTRSEMHSWRAESTRTVLRHVQERATVKAPGKRQRRRNTEDNSRDALPTFGRFRRRTSGTVLTPAVLVRFLSRPSPFMQYTDSIIFSSSESRAVPHTFFQEFSSTSAFCD